jgi:uncharacterized membrane protein YjjP (DUF1212 family)
MAYIGTRSKVKRRKEVKKSYSRHHMAIPWHDYAVSDDRIMAVDASLTEKSSIIGRVGLIMLACGTGSWRVRSSMNIIAEVLGVTCTADVGLVSIEYTCMDGSSNDTQALDLKSTRVDTHKLALMEDFVVSFEDKGNSMSVEQIHTELDKLQNMKGLYSPFSVGAAAALACAAFTFLLGGGLIEMLCAFFGAGVGNWLRRKMNDMHLQLYACTGASVAVACLVYMGMIKALELFMGVSPAHEAGYICAMLFVIPGFPFITSGIDLSKLDMRSGIERLTYSIMIIVVATLVAWIIAITVHFKPADFVPLDLSVAALLLLRIPASFCGVYGFSIMFNSPRKMAAVAGLIGAVANTLRLELVDLTTMPGAAAAFFGALTAGLLASLIKKYIGFPRISLTVPSIVIMVPGLFMYRAFYNIGISSIAVGAYWFTKATLIVLALPLGLIFARIFTDTRFRHCN